MRLRYAPLWLLLACATSPPTVASPAPAVLWAALDGEALYTLAGGLKPVSAGFWQTWIDVANPDLAPLQAVRRDLAVWRNDELWADVHVFHEAHDGRRAALAYVVDRAALADLLEREAAFFAPYGLCPDTHPAEVLAVVERLPRLDRHRGQGLLYGYPRHAIDFFVAAEEARAPGEVPAPRRFVDLPTFGGARGRFVYAVPADAHEHPDDRQLAAAALGILDRCRQLRSAAPATDLPTTSWLVARLREEFAPAPAAR